MKTENQNSSQSSNVLFWEHMYEKQLEKIERLIDSKLKHLEKLRHLPLDEKNIVAIEIIQNELYEWYYLLEIMEQIKMAYIKETGSVATLLLRLSSENKCLKIQLLELKLGLDTESKLSARLLEISLNRKEVKNVE